MQSTTEIAIFAAVKYQNTELHNSVKQAAQKKFGDKSSYVKNLWILKEYKKRGGKVKYSGEKPSGETIKKNVQKDVERLRSQGSFEVDLSGPAKKHFIQTELNALASEIETDEEIQDLACDLEYFESVNFDEFNDYVDAVDNQDKIDEVYSKYHATVNMGYSALKSWAENPCSKVASLSRGPINRNLSLLSKKKTEWTMSDVRSANRTISFVSRMKGVKTGEPTKTPDGKTCEAKNIISLKNWAYNP